MKKHIEFFVAPEGSDTNPGTLGAPFATLGRARAAVREQIAGGVVGDLRVWVREGCYALSETFILGVEDSPEAGTVTYAAYPGEAPVLSGGYPLSGWQRLTHAPADLPTAAADHVWVADVPVGASFHALFDSEGLLTRAHSEHKQTAAGQVEDPRRHLHFCPGDIADWSDLAEAELVITPRYPWVVNYLKLEHVDEDACIARTTLPATYALVAPAGDQNIELFYRIENRLAYLDGPGQWVLDSTAGKLYLWPRSGQPEGVIAPRLRELIRIEGNFEQRQWAHHISLEGLTFSHCDRMVWEPDRRSLQHDWEFEDTPNALVRLRGVDKIGIRDCCFVESGSGGVRLDLHAVDCIINSNAFQELGGTGIALLGYGPGSRDENHHNTVSRNHIHHVGRLWWQSSAMFISQSGHNQIHDNLMHHLPYAGLVVSGPRPAIFERDDISVRTEGALTMRWDEMGDLPKEWWAHVGWKHSRFNVIEHNEVHHAMEVLGDGNAIYISGTGEGNIVRRNYVHDISGKGTTAGIRNDDEQFFALIEENVVWRIQACGIITKHINMVENNIIVDCYGDGGARDFCYLSLRHKGPSYGSGLRRNILFRPRDRHEPQLAFLQASHLLLEAAADDNLMWCELKPEEARAELHDHQGRNKCLRSLAEDPLFVDAANGDFRLQPDSPAFHIGFRPIDTWGVRGPVGPSIPAEPDATA